MNSTLPSSVDFGLPTPVIGLIADRLHSSKDLAALARASRSIHTAMSQHSRNFEFMQLGKPKCPNKPKILAKIIQSGPTDWTKSAGVGENGLSVMHFAVLTGVPEVVEMALKAGFASDEPMATQSKNTPFDVAARNSHLEGHPQMETIALRLLEVNKEKIKTDPKGFILKVICQCEKSSVVEAAIKAAGLTHDTELLLPGGRYTVATLIRAKNLDVPGTR